MAPMTLYFVKDLDARRNIMRVDNREYSSLGSIKIKILSFQCKNDPEAYLE